MGCDIHAYVEYVSWENKDKEYWSCLMSNIGSRNYLWFDVLAGVRGNDHQVFPTRGMPEGAISWEVRDAAYMHIAQTDDQAGWEGWTTREQATRWGEPIFKLDGYEFCGHPDWHSHSWLTADELAQCIGAYMMSGADFPYGVEWDAVLAAMRALEERGHKTRLVFWFDN
jgi:hypothetical protein